MELINREVCAISGLNDLEHLYTFKNYPLFMGCTNQPIEEDINIDMEWSIGRSSGTIQLTKLIPLHILYQENHNSVIGNIWKKHHSAFAKFIKKFEPSEGILEIGGAHGYLSMIYQKDYNIPWTIIELNPSPIKGCRANFIKGIFTEKNVQNIQFDTLVHSHVLEHIYEPNKFFSLIEKSIEDKNKVIFSIPNMSKMLECKYTNCLNFEHTIFFDESLLNFLINKHGFRIIDKEYFLNDHSIFYCLEKTKNPLKINSYKSEYSKNFNTFNDYVQYYQKLIKKVNLQIEYIDDCNQIYLFGAHIFSQHLIVNNLDIRRVKSILDNDPKKQGKRLYGTNLIVNSPECIKNDLQPHVIIKAGVYTNEIKEDILNNINKSTVFIE